ncbi:MAG: hypothetical protein K9L56_15265 [Clostridiales bacterium]|nr:hypothetical protein [Clostridiales bacterium]
MNDKIHYKINYDTDWSIHLYLGDKDLETLISLYEHHRSVLVNNITQMFRDKDYKAMITSMEPFEDRIKNSIVLYILLCDTIGYTIELNTRLFFKDIEGRWIGYDTVDGKLTRYDDEDKEKLLDKLRS